MKASLITAPIVYETKTPLFFSFYSDGAFEKKWLPWKPLYFELREDGSLIYYKNKNNVVKKISNSLSSTISNSLGLGSSNGAFAGDGATATSLSPNAATNTNTVTEYKGAVILDVSISTIQKIPVDGGSGSGGDGRSSVQLGVISDVGVRVTCKQDGLDSEFRCVFPSTELMLFVDALSSVSNVKNLKQFKAVMQWDNQPDWIPISSNSVHQNPLLGTFIDPTSHQATLYSSSNSNGNNGSNSNDVSAENELHQTISAGKSNAGTTTAILGAHQHPHHSHSHQHHQSAVSAAGTRSGPLSNTAYPNSHSNSVHNELAHILDFASSQDRDVAIHHFETEYNNSHNNNNSNSNNNSNAAGAGGGVGGGVTGLFRGFGNLLSHGHGGGYETPTGKRNINSGKNSSTTNMFTGELLGSHHNHGNSLGNAHAHAHPTSTVLQTIDQVGGESLCTHLGNMQQSSADGRQYIIQQSSMRRAVTAAMDQYDRENRRIQTIARRGAFKWLPVYFTNDLVHGSWWFVFGSLYTTVISFVILFNSYYPHSLLGEETGVVLPINMYRFTWMLLTFSGTLMTIGSLAFVRAVNEPPMKPLLGCWKHTGTDELLGSWLFFWGTMPAIPYSLCYLAILQNYAYLGMLFISIVSVLATYLFVLSCYPSSERNGARASNLLKCCVCMCGPKPMLLKHIANDWLAGCWFMYYGCVLGTIACLVLFIYECVRHHDRSENYTVALFVYGTSFSDYIGFLIGSLYFVAGSYPVNKKLSKQQHRGVSNSTNSSSNPNPNRDFTGLGGLSDLNGLGDNGNGNDSDSSDLDPLSP